MRIEPGSKVIKSGTMTSIIDIFCGGGYAIHVFQGSLSPSDILLKYSSPSSKRPRTPKHIHWAVDLLLKKTGNECLTSSFLDLLYNWWNGCSILTGNSYSDVKTVIDSSLAAITLSSFVPLDSLGEYPTEFLYILMCLLAVQEKTNATAHGTVAKMFGDVLVELKKPNLDIFKIMSTAGFGGR